MPTIQVNPTLESIITQFVADTVLAHQLVNGGSTEYVQTEGGSIPTFANVLSRGLLGAGVTALVSGSLDSNEPNQVFDSVPSSVVRSAKYLIQLTSGSSYQVMELLIIHDGTNPSIVSYADNAIPIGTSIASFNAQISDGSLQLLISPTSSNVSIQATRTVLGY